MGGGQRVVFGRVEQCAVVASAFGITVQAGMTVTGSVAQALAGRRLLVVLDNCKHVLDAAADLVEAVLARTNTVKVIATSREGLRVGGEHLWPVPSLDVRDLHARYYAAQAIVVWDLWDGPGYDTAVDWVEVELDSLRTGFRWATDRSDIDTATAIAAHTAMLAWGLQQFEPVGWAEELLPWATTADVAQLPRLYVADSCCTNVGRPVDGVGYAQAASVLQDDPGYQPFDIGWPASGRLPPTSTLGGVTGAWRSAPLWPPEPVSPGSWVYADWQ